jgi:hypothetical protein
MNEMEIFVGRMRQLQLREQEAKTRAAEAEADLYELKLRCAQESVAANRKEGVTFS